MDVSVIKRTAKKQWAGDVQPHLSTLSIKKKSSCLLQFLRNNSYEILQISSYYTSVSDMIWGWFRNFDPVCSNRHSRHFNIPDVLIFQHDHVCNGISLQQQQYITVWIWSLLQLLSAFGCTLLSGHMVIFSLLSFHTISLEIQLKLANQWTFCLQILVDP